MPQVLLVPGLLDVDAGALTACAPLARVAALGRGERVDDGEAELLRALDCPIAPAPLAALGAGLDVGGDWIARADPVTTFVSHDDVRIVGRVDDLGADEVVTLRALLDRHFADDGLAFLAPRNDTWFVRCAAAQSVAMPPLAAVVGRPLRSRLPTGDDAKRWRRWWTEVQMLLHDQPIAARQRAPVHALWFAGGGVLPERRPAPIAARATTSRGGDVLRGLAQLGGTPATALGGPGEALISAQAVAADPVDARTLPDFASRVLQPLLDALGRGLVDRLVLIAGGRDGAARWTLARPGLLDRLRRRSAAFVLPPADEP